MENTFASCGRSAGGVKRDSPWLATDVTVFASELDGTVMFEQVAAHRFARRGR